MKFCDCFIQLKEGAGLLILYTNWQSLHIMLGEANVLALGSFPSQIFNLRGQNVSHRNSPLWEFFWKNYLHPNENLVQMLQE